ncbi:membrane protein insertase YidC [Tissierella sp. MB52-C2]|uniref:membrane protein insertase YidC n=1 Tax=Tissierella sp. MB52-C2 TaxID=3070999 RepID=UPI00280A7377|nr:membrane protein insertase YidC [Tissierella sp. MB52-C2]WMM23877.1 membrane protein insertase YidC [Tissierella sp. MB52-C2]
MSNLLSSVLNILFNFTNDWGLAIVALTILVKVLLLPLSIKQKMALLKQREFTTEIDEIRKKYRDNETKMNEELTKYYTKNGSSLLGSFTGLIQIPILIILFNVIKANSVDTGSILVPWASSLKSYDTSYIIPLVYALVSISPNLLNYIGYLRRFDESKPLKQNIVSIIIISIILTSRSPVGIGIYFITSSIITFIEELIYRLILRNNYLKQI